MRWLIGGVLAALCSSPAAAQASSKPNRPPVAGPKTSGASSAIVPPVNDADPPVQRTVIHSEAYKKREYLGPHINIKVTPPEDRGVKGRVLVEVYNYSKVFFSIVDFWLILTNKWGDKIEVHITCDDIKPNWSALRWVRIPGAKEVPKMDTVVVKQMQIFDEKGKRVPLKHYIDLIKK